MFGDVSARIYDQYRKFSYRRVWREKGHAVLSGCSLTFRQARGWGVLQKTLAQKREAGGKKAVSGGTEGSRSCSPSCSGLRAASRACRGSQSVRQQEGTSQALRCTPP